MRMRDFMKAAFQINRNVAHLFDKFFLFVLFLISYYKGTVRQVSQNNTLASDKFYNLLDKFVLSNAYLSEVFSLKNVSP